MPSAKTAELFSYGRAGEGEALPETPPCMPDQEPWRVTRAASRWLGLAAALLLWSGCTAAGQPPLPTATHSGAAAASPSSSEALAASPSSSEVTAEPQARPTAAPGQGGEAYTNSDYQLSLVYPAAWIVQSDTYQQVVLVPEAAQGWQPSAPAEIAKDPRARVTLGSYIQETQGPASFPAELDAASLRAWLEQKVRAGEARDLKELTINQIPAFTLTEAGMSGCERVVYWRPESLERLVRVATGCESPYLQEFDQIVSSLQQAQ